MPGVWPQISGSLTANFPSRSSRFLLENCGQTNWGKKKPVKKLDKTMRFAKWQMINGIFQALHSLNFQELQKFRSYRSSYNSSEDSFFVSFQRFEVLSELQNSCNSWTTSESWVFSSLYFFNLKGFLVSVCCENGLFLSFWFFKAI